MRHHDQTALHGKYLHAYGPADPRPAGWTFWDPLSRGVYDHWSFTLGNNGAPRRYDGRYLTDVLSARTNASVRRFASSGEPFFIWSSHVAPHGKWDGRWMVPPGRQSAPRDVRAHPPSLLRPTEHQRAPHH